MSAPSKYAALIAEAREIQEALAGQYFDAEPEYAMSKVVALADALIASEAEVARLEAQVAAVRRVRAYWGVRYYNDYAYALPFCGDIDRALSNTKAIDA